jgi:hypothetical protein
MTKTPEQMAREYAEFGTQGVPDSIRKQQIMAKDKIAFLAGYQAAMNSPEKPDTCEHILDMEKMVDVNSSNNSNGWISVKERLPTDADGVTQLWMRGRSLAELVLGCHAVMFEYNEKIEGVLDMNKSDGIWDLSDFTHWMPLPKPPEEK